MRPSLASVLALLALAATLASLIVAGVASLAPGVVAENPGGIVRWVDPRGPGWVSGVRQGQRVESLAAADDESGWAIETSDGLQRHRFSLPVAEAALRATVPLVAVGVVAATFAVAVSRTRRRRSELLAATAIALASTPYLIADPGPVGAATVVGATVLPAIWVARWGGITRSVGLALAGCAAAVAGTWLGLELTEAPVSAQAATILAAVLVATAAMTMMAMGVTPKRVLAALRATRTLDVLVIVGTVALAVVLAAASVAPVVIALAVLVPLASYARARSAVGGLADRLILAEFREREALRATEEERARISREIHDAPLQAIAGVIAQLEDPTGDRAVARDSLREVAEHLRDMATDLHPPVLDDLGLAPAIEFIARGSRGQVVVNVSNHAGYGRLERPPADVELAVFRIVAEALANATHHANAQRVAVAGAVSPEAIEVRVVDDGCGIPPARIEEAMQSGRMGIASMRRRAAAIDAELSIHPSPDGGTEVAIQWMA